MASIRNWKTTTILCEWVLGLIAPRHRQSCPTRPAVLDYSERLTFTTGAQRQNDLQISIKPVKGNSYFVVDRSDGKVSGYLLDHTGRLLDFNSESVSTGEQYNEEKFNQVGRTANSNISTTSTVVTEFSLEFPGTDGALGRRATRWLSCAARMVPSGLLIGTSV